MGGFREQTGGDKAYALVLAITGVSFVLLPAMLAIYLIAIQQRRRKKIDL